MARVFENVMQMIGHTPLLHAQKYTEKRGIPATLLTKMEGFNPAGSAKDRIAVAMIDDAEQKGILKEGSVVIEPTSGNTGIGLASICAAKGYRIILTMPDTMSVERRKLLAAYGAEVVLTEGSKGMQGAIEKAQELAQELPDAYIPGQFTNQANPMAHYRMTGPELWEDTDGKIDIFVAGVGTGGTVSGIGKYLKERNSKIKIVAVEPASSPLLTKGVAGPHKLQGIGANFVPDTFDQTIPDEVLPIENEDAFLAGREFSRAEGILVGITAGAALYAAELLAKRPENHGKVIVALLPDSGERYLSTELFN